MAITFYKAGIGWSFSMLLASFLLFAGCQGDNLGATHAALVSGAAFTTDNVFVDGDSRDVCKNSSINCNIYGAKEFVWLNGGPTANGLGPDGEYFFAVLVPGGQPDPNDDGAKNLSDDFDDYTNRTFTVTDGEVSEYLGTHVMDSGDFLDPGRRVCRRNRGCEPDGNPPLIQLAPYADTTNPGGVYIMAICSLENGYPVAPRDCKYDAFKVKEGPVTYDLMLSGMKFLDTFADGVKDDAATDPGLAGWTITIQGTGFAGEPIDAMVFTDENGYWDYSMNYTFNRNDDVFDAVLTVCEIQQPGYYQSYPDPSCHELVLEPSALASVGDLDFGNWQPVDITACKEHDLDGNPDTDDSVPVPGWPVSLTENGVVVDSQVTGDDGCFTWGDLTPGPVYGVMEGSRPGWFALGDTWVEFERAGSGSGFLHTFFNAVYQGCTPGFWQGGSDGGQAGGQWLWNEVDDPEWVASGGMDTNPYIWTVMFNEFFTPTPELDGLSMMDLVDTGGGSVDAQKAGRSMVAAYLNASWGMSYPYSTDALVAMWDDAVASGEFLALHMVLDSANNAMYRTEGGPHCPISASGY